MRTHLAWTACLILAMTASFAQSAERLVTFDRAARNGLQRAWFAQIEVDRTRNRIASWMLHKDRLYALTTGGTIHVLDAETGETHWVVQVGLPSRPTVGPVVNDAYLVVINGSRLYVLDNHDGHIVGSRTVGSAPADAPALSEHYAYVALLNGRVEGYRLDDPTATVWYYQSAGYIFQSPTTTGQVVSWSTDRGNLYVSRAEDPGVIYRAEMNDEIVATPAEGASYLYVASLNGYLYCMEELTGNLRWRYATGFPVTSTPAIVGEKAYVASEAPALHAVDTASGRPLWATSGISQFVAQGPKQVYGFDGYGSLLVLDSETGEMVGRLKVGEGARAIVNDQTDRIFLVSDRGLVQCLREIGASKPTHYRKSSAEEKEVPEEIVNTEEPLADEETTEGTDEPVVADEEDSPFESDTAEPRDAEPSDAADSDDPFGDDFDPFAE